MGWYYLLPNIKASALLIVGELDTDILKQNIKAFDYLDCHKKLDWYRELLICSKKEGPWKAFVPLRERGLKITCNL